MKNVNYQKKKLILCFIEYYLPGYKSGGPVKTISSFVNYFGDKYDINIVCLDRDYLDKKPYPKKNFNKWHKVKKAKVFYISKKNLNSFTIFQILNKQSYDLLYLNGLYSYKFNILPLILRKLNLINNNIPCIVAPRGMLSPSAINIKFTKKKLFLIFVNLLGLYKNISLQASSLEEKKNILKSLNIPNNNIFIAPNLTNVKPVNEKVIKLKKNGTLELVFLSRISPMKNLDFLLQSLSKVTIKVNLTIFGNSEDDNYLKKCFKLKDQLPDNINVFFKGHVKNEIVHKVLNSFDLFVLPTRGENFGHVILESLSAGLPVLVSNKVFWKSDKSGGLKTLPLKHDIWAKEINNWAKFNNHKILKKKMAALDYAKKFLTSKKSLELNTKLFKYLFKIEK